MQLTPAVVRFGGAVCDGGAKMERRERNTCPNCGKQLEIVGNGRVGRCPVHRAFFPLQPDAAEEAARLGAEWQKKREQERRSIDRKRQEQLKAFQRGKRNSALVKIVAVLAVLAVAGAAAAWFVVLPRMNYSSAETLFAQGDYQAARAKYAALGDYENSDDKALLCDALISLQSGTAADVMDSLDALSANADALSGVLQDTLVPAVERWEAQGIAPQSVLTLLQYADALQLTEAMDTARLFEDAHVAMAMNEGVLEHDVADVNGDGEDELVVLNGDYSVAAYEMQKDGNVRITLSDAERAACLLAFGGMYDGRDAEQALACYQQAYNLHQNEDTRLKVAQAYQARAVAYENAGDYEAALADAAYASNALGDADALDFYYQMTLRGCQAEADLQQAIACWDAFASGSAAALVRHGRTADANAVSAALRLEYARELADAGDAACIGWLEEALRYGADVEEAVLDAANSFPVGPERVALRQLAMRVYADDAQKQAAQKALLGEEVRSALEGWSSLGMEVQEVFYLLGKAEELELDLGALDAEAVYQEAALAAASDDGLQDYRFVDFNGDGTQELLGVDAGGALLYYGAGFDSATRWETGLSGAKLDVPAGETPTVLLETESGFAAFVWREGALKQSFAVDGVVDYQRSGSEMTYGVTLPGSIRRSERYSYTIGENAAVLTGIDWLENAYPAPHNAAEAATRWLEAVGYGLEGETALLLAEDGEAVLAFSRDYLLALPVPAMPLDAAVESYYEAGGLAMCSMEYAAADGGRVTAYVSLKQDGGWMLTGAGNNPDGVGESAVAEGDATLPLLEPGEALTDRLSDKSDVNLYRVMLLTSAKVELEWQAAKGEYTVSLHKGEPDAAAHITYSAPGRQEPLFLSAGVYYVRVAATRYADADYQLTLNAEASLFCEQEGNDSPATANQVDVGTVYSASLQTKGDRDTYAFTLEQPGKVYLTLETAGGGKSAVWCNVVLVDSGDVETSLLAGSMNGDESLCRTGNVYLAAGRYVFQIQSGSAWTAGEYRFTVHLEADDKLEQEPNATVQQASPLPVNEAITGNSRFKGDVDIYAVDLADGGVLKAQMTYPANKSTNQLYSMEISSEAYVLWTGAASGEAGRLESSELAVPAGRYYVKVTNAAAYDSDYRIQAAFIPALVETESNDSTPMDLILNMEIQGSLMPVVAQQAGADVDNFGFALTEPGCVRLHFNYDAPGGSGSSFVLALGDRDAPGSALYSRTISMKESGVSSGNIYLGAGNYYVQVSTPARKTPWVGAYGLMVEFEPAEVPVENERNDTHAAATAIAPGGTVRGSFAVEGDVDCFALTLTEPALIQPRLNYTPVENSSTMYKLYVSGDAGVLLEAKLKGDKPNAAIVPLALPAGEYIITLENVIYNALDYELSVAFEGVTGAEAEPNNAAVSATPLEMGAKLTGVLSASGDVDVYAFTFTEQTTATLTFNFGQKEGGEFKLKVEQNGKSLWSSTVDADGNDVAVPVQLSAGTYYLSVSASTAQEYSANPYTIELTQAQ